MSNNILTPLQIWGEYDPRELPLQASFTNFDDKGSYYYVKGFFNGGQYEDGVVRVTFVGRLPKDCKNVAIVVDEKAYKRDVESMADLVDIDYGVIFYDFVGEGQKGLHTIYPESIKYANLIYAGDHLTKAIPTAKDTCYFVWTKVLRRVITLVEQIVGQDANVFLLGHRRGADLVWQAAAMDERVKGIITIFNAGWTEYNTSTIVDGEIVIDDERERWLTGCATQTYAKFVKAPILYLGASNSDLTSIDRLESTMSVVENASDIKTYICGGLSCSINKSAINLIKEWLRKTSLKETLPTPPNFELDVVDEELTLTLQYEEDTQRAKEVVVYVSYDEVDPRLRNWKKFIMPQGSLELKIPVGCKSKKVYVYLNAKYEGDYYLSSLMQSYDLHDKVIKEATLKKSHIIYEKKKGLSYWLVEDEDSILAPAPILKAGAYDIMGITAERGDISTYVIGQKNYVGEAGNLMQFDCYCETERDLKVIVMAECESGGIKEFSCEIRLEASKEWQKHSIELQFLKSEDLVGLKSWDKAKKLTFEDINGVLISNILWV